jgi:hypothetical protein
MKFAPVSFCDVNGERQQVALQLSDYKAAEKMKLSLPQYLNRKYQTNPDKYGHSFAQMLASAGLFLQSDNNYGIKPPTIGQILEGDLSEVALSTNSVTLPDGSQSDTPAGRLLFPAALLAMIESNLRPDLETYIGSFYAMIGQTVNVNSPRYDQVIIDYTNPRNARGNPIAQLALPSSMLTITTSQTTKTIPTVSIGMEISTDALKLATLDLVGLAVSEQTINERAARMINDLTGIVSGSIDAGSAALASTPIHTYDATIAANGVCTQKGYVKWLRNNWLKRRITDVVCDVDAFLAIQGRTGRPTVLDISGMDERLNAIPVTGMKGIDDQVNFFITDGSPLGANTVLGLDRRKALRRVVYVGADYSAVEEFVLRKGMGMRIDWAERIESMGYSEAFELMTLTTA